MSCYIGSNNNRFYVGLEESYGVASDLQSLRRIPAVSLKARRSPERLTRRDKTGSRTFMGLPGRLKHKTSFELSTYLTGWTDQNRAPVYGALFEAGLGSAGRMFDGRTVSASDGLRVTVTANHGLQPGQAVACDGEIRFVTAIQDDRTVLLNAPFSAGLAAGSELIPTYTYMPGSGCPKGVSIYDYWTPATALHRLATGCAVDRIQIDVNGDFHGFKFSGPAADLIDSATFTSGEAGLQQFPQEPAEPGFDYTIVPGHLGQAWIGIAPNRVFTLASARTTVDNNVDLRQREFGYDLPRAIVPGERDVRVNFALYAQDNAETKSLYEAARQRSPMSVMLQLGQQNGQLCGVFMKSVIAETPEFDDSETRLMWSFQNCRAQGSGDDEIVVAFA